MAAATYSGQRLPPSCVVVTLLGAATGVSAVAGEGAMGAAAAAGTAAGSTSVVTGGGAAAADPSASRRAAARAAPSAYRSPGFFAIARRTTAPSAGGTWS